MYNQEARGDGSGTTYSGYSVYAGETVIKTDDYFDVGYKVYIGPKQYFVTSDVGHGRLQWYAFLVLPPGTKAEGSKRDYIAELFKDWSPDIHKVLDATLEEEIEQRDLYDRPPEIFRSWSEGDVTMLGDAVHPMMPNLGQGGGQAMEDAYILTNILAEVTDRRQIPRKLQEYYWKRIVRVSAVQGLSRYASDVIISTFDTPWSFMDDVQPLTYSSFCTTLLRPVLPIIFLLQFGYLYSYHPATMEGAMPRLVRNLAARHKKEAEEAWQNQERGTEFHHMNQFA
uniref:FAD-binding domain-containing protein n=1 Tax=Eutreptiella gymnastica TaxID=73025 RepID=A0A7S4CI63_9EUGL